MKAAFWFTNDSKNTLPLLINWETMGKHTHAHIHIAIYVNHMIQAHRPLPTIAWSEAGSAGPRPPRYNGMVAPRPRLWSL